MEENWKTNATYSQLDLAPNAYRLQSLSIFNALVKNTALTPAALTAIIGYRKGHYMML